ncbi:MAG: aspartate--tRNA ligase [Candidatus Ryanbacteria bacterium CG10_big_fil_rev_8_21_14_0_10_43_42]|uniref:Aspartate--tRNA(Asp/Asn) ligase n=1 Tax=Candidatus Ryanbacteria bacterium CG10_big_fil_rev_8_21_14_0_10_43_42 TaxID=1974864 RepID=A0A2M8KW58_9BACT|nr:MAG: aspartate--tRNA ligase [Candidatus Ryanbacteria bacterium CG10_big_fil_rev_8_21_14_0_10_43_42]
MENRTHIKDIVNKEGEEVTLAGWVDTRRDHGKLIFIDLRDTSDIAQIVFFAGNKGVYAIADTLRSEWVISVTGTVKKRPDNMVNEDLPTGKFELDVTGVEILNTAKTPPFSIAGDGYDIGEEHRMKYRYLDLRRARMQKNFALRSKAIKTIRDFLSARDFLEIETPLLTKSTPEGARDYLVPSRLQQGTFYALPQSPQQYKQLLMTAGFERYFQIARCLRDEDTRGDRQPEFTQLDMELAFTERENVMQLNEDLITHLVQKIAPEKIIQEMPFPRLTYKEAIEKYNSDRPDLRKDKEDPNLLAFCWIIDFPFFEKTDKGEWTFTHNPFSRPIPEHEEWLHAKEHIGDIITSQYDIALNGYEIAGGSIRNHKPELLEKVFEIMGFEKNHIEKEFGHMMEALSYGAPPHGGIAWGLDRLIALLTNEPNIREVIAFPKTGDGRDLMMNAPSPATEEQLNELGIRIIEEKK